MGVLWWEWLGFFVFIVGLLALDLFVFHRTGRRASLQAAAAWTSIWIALGLAFAIVVWARLGSVAAGQYLAGYLVEYSLSVDNLFVWALLISYFAVPAAYQPRVLLFGVLGAILFRAIFILVGTALISHLPWVSYLFGAFIILTGLRMAQNADEEIRPDRNPVLHFIRAVLPVTNAYRSERLLVREQGRLAATPLLVALVMVATMDVVFAVDSIPAIFAITLDPFVVFSSNAFAVLGLRALYFLLSAMMRRFAYLKLGLAALLVLVGNKMLLKDTYEIPIAVSLIVIVLVITAAILASVWVERRRKSARQSQPAPVTEGGKW
jgi:tellurite resistance protein TerC